MAIDNLLYSFDIDIAKCLMVLGVSLNISVLFWKRVHTFSSVKSGR